MLYIMQNNGFTTNVPEEQQWHVGEPMPLIKARVVTFQADSDELEVIIEAIKNASKK